MNEALLSTRVSWSTSTGQLTWSCAPYEVARSKRVPPSASLNGTAHAEPAGAPDSEAEVVTHIWAEDMHVGVRRGGKARGRRGEWVNLADAPATNPRHHRSEWT